MKTILLIEDEKLLGQMYKDRLSLEGLNIIWATDAKEGLILTEKEKPDLIILDILLPRESGIDFLRQLRENKNTASMPVMVFSNFDDPATKKQALELGAKEYLMKTNYNPSEIIAKIKQLLSEG